jgi:hypothetical protein
MLKKTFILIITTLILTTSIFSAPTICDEALRRCVVQCDIIFEPPFNQACRAGCGIGYINCIS